MSPTKRQRRKRRKRREAGDARAGSAPPASDATAPERVEHRDTGSRGTPGTGRPERGRSRPGDGPPRPPWGSFPLSELVVLVAIVLLLAGFIVSPPRGTVMIGTGLALGSLAGLELAAREHLAGYRSHTLLLAGAVGVVVVGVLFLAGALPPAVRVLAGAVAFVPAAWLFAEAFRRRSGGALFRFKA